MQSISQKDKQILRGLAAKQRELAASPLNSRRVEEWKEHNNFRGKRPMIHLELWTFQQEVLQPRLVCEGAAARQLEQTLYTHFLNMELFDDDKIVPDYFPVEWQVQFIPFGIEEQVSHSEEGGLGHHFDPVIEDLEQDYEKLGRSVWSVDRDATARYTALAEDCFGDILPVKPVMNCLYSVPTQQIVHRMGMENMFLALYDAPDLFKTMMQRYADDTLAYFRWMEKEQLLLPTCGGESLGQGSLCFTEELPSCAPADRPLRTRDCWGFLDSQETVGIAPEMFEEFFFPCYRQIAEQFGLLSYGCCEPVHTIWERCLSKLENLRKISISPWCDEEFMGEQLRGKQVIYHRKPSPNFLGVPVNLDEDALRAHIQTTLSAARGCKLEITQRDVYTIHHDIAKARRYVAIIREEIENHWQ